MFNLFKKRSEKGVGIKYWDRDPGPGFRVITNEDSIQYVNEDASKVIYFSVLIVQGNSHVAGDALHREREPEIVEDANGWQFKGMKAATGQVLVCVVTVKDQADLQWAKEFFSSVRYKNIG